MAMSLGANLEKPGEMSRGIKETVLSAVAKLSLDPSRTLASVDLSNVVNWDSRGLEVAEVSKHCRYFIDELLLGDFLTDKAVFSEARVFMPGASFTASIVGAATDWVMSVHPELLNSSVFEQGSVNDDRLNFALKLGNALEKYLTKNEINNIDKAFREKVKTVIRGARYVQKAEAFTDKGLKVFSGMESLRENSLKDDKTHRRVVDKMFEEIHRINSLKAILRERLAVSSQSESSATAENAGGSWYGSELEKIFVGLDSLEKLLKEEISASIKCDLDPLIVAKSLAPDTLAKFDTHAIFSGDGDFIPLYTELHSAGKNVVVVSPDFCLNKQVKALGREGIVTIHNPTMVDRIWRKRLPAKR